MTKAILFIDTIIYLVLQHGPDKNKSTFPGVYKGRKEGGGRVQYFWVTPMAGIFGVARQAEVPRDEAPPREQAISGKPGHTLQWARRQTLSAQVCEASRVTQKGEAIRGREPFEKTPHRNGGAAPEGGGTAQVSVPVVRKFP